MVAGLQRRIYFIKNKLKELREINGEKEIIQKY